MEKEAVGLELVNGKTTDLLSAVELPVVEIDQLRDRSKDNPVVAMQTALPVMNRDPVQMNLKRPSEMTFKDSAPAINNSERGIATNPPLDGSLPAGEATIGERFTTFIGLAGGSKFFTSLVVDGLVSLARGMICYDTFRERGFLAGMGELTGCTDAVEGLDRCVHGDGWGALQAAWGGFQMLTFFTGVGAAANRLGITGARTVFKAALCNVEVERGFAALGEVMIKHLDLGEAVRAVARYQGIILKARARGAAALRGELIKLERRGGEVWRLLQTEERRQVKVAHDVMLPHLKPITNAADKITEKTVRKAADTYFAAMEKSLKRDGIAGLTKKLVADYSASLQKLGRSAKEAQQSAEKIYTHDIVRQMVRELHSPFGRKHEAIIDQLEKPFFNALAGSEEAPALKQAFREIFDDGIDDILKPLADKHGLNLKALRKGCDDALDEAVEMGIKLGIRSGLREALKRFRRGIPSLIGDAVVGRLTDISIEPQDTRTNFEFSRPDDAQRKIEALTDSAGPIRRPSKFKTFVYEVFKRKRGPGDGENYSDYGFGVKPHSSADQNSTIPGISPSQINGEHRDENL